MSKMSQLTRHIILLFLLGLSKTRALPMTLAGDSNNNKDEIFFVEKMVRHTNLMTNSTATLITFDGGSGGGGGGGDGVGSLAIAAVAAAVEEELRHDNESVLDTSAGATDDLIFIAAKKQNHLQEQQKNHHRGIHQIDVLTVEDIYPFSAETSSSTSCETRNVDDNAGTVALRNAPNKMELHADVLTSHQPSRPSIDMSDFVALIPAVEIKSIVVNYYRNDPEVQRAYAYLNGREFAELKQRIIMIPEMSKFLRYLNASGLDVVGFLYTITNLTSKPSNVENGMDQSKANTLGAQGNGNELDKISLPVTTTSTWAAALSTTLVTTTTTLETTTTTSESLNGLHGLVDSILDILPQDQILSTFFDKLETNEQFSKLVDNVGSPDFAKILYNMENSIPLRNLIFTLHNNGIYITRIVDSLKAYFFLGTF